MKIKSINDVISLTRMVYTSSDKYMKYAIVNNMKNFRILYKYKAYDNGTYKFSSTLYYHYFVYLNILKYE